MNTKNQNIDFLKTDSLDFQDSNLKVNNDTYNLDTAFMVAEGYKTNHKEVYYTKTDNSPKQARLNGQLILPKDNTPPAKVEINQLAKTWCELLLNQMQETHDKPLFTRAFDPNLEENKYRGFLINH